MYAPHAPLPGPQAPLSGGEAVLIGLAALVVVALPFLWPLAEHFNAIAHEGAHALVGSVMGFGIKSVTLTMDPRAGETEGVVAIATTAFDERDPSAVAGV